MHNPTNTENDAGESTQGLDERLSTGDIVERLKRIACTPPNDPFPPTLPKSEGKAAAVLIPLLRIEAKWHLLFIRRAQNRHDAHSGQVAFPGGRHESADSSLEATALREAQEEIALAPQHVRILGRLNEHVSITNYCVTPVVGVMPWPYELTPEPNEVARCFTVPLSWLADPTNHEIRYQRPPGTSAFPVVYFREFDGEILWGTTARITLTLIDVLTTGRYGCPQLSPDVL